MFSSMLIFLNHAGVGIPRRFTRTLGLSRKAIPPLTLEWLEVLLGQCLYADVANYAGRDAEHEELMDDLRRLDISVGVDYGTEPQKVIDLLVEVAEQQPSVSSVPKPTALFSEFADSSLEFKLRAWTLSDQYLLVSSDLRVGISRALKKAGIGIPFPQRDLHLRSIDKNVSLPIAQNKGKDP